jgi:DNA helicase HerA-like ATPase
MVRLEEGERIGELALVDPDQLEIDLADPAASARVTVSDLVALPAGQEFLVGIVSGVARAGRGPGEAPSLVARVMPVGTFDPAAAAGGAFRLGAARHPVVGAPCHLLEGEQLRGFMAALGSDVPADERLVLGHYLADTESPAIADGNRLLQRHLSVLGNTGAGKSWTVALLLERAARLRHSNLIVLDLHGEYASLCEPADGRPPMARRLRIAGPNDLLLAGEDALHVPYWLLERDELLSLILNEQDPDAPDQRLALTDRVQTLKRSTLSYSGSHDAIATATVDSPVPYQLQHLVDWLKRDEIETIIRHPTGRVDPGPFNGKLGGLISRLEARIADPRYGFIFQPPEYTEQGDWLVDTASRLMSSAEGEPGIKVVDLSEVPSAILPLVAGVLGRLVYNVQFWMRPEDRTPVCLVCDEAHLYLPAAQETTPVERVALGAFEAIAKEGRKYGVCLMVISQRPSDVSHTILSQCNNFIVMRLTNDLDQQVIAHVVPGALADIRGLLPMLDVGEALVIGDALLMPTRIKINRPQIRPDSATMPLWTMWSTRPASHEAIAAGVNALRSQWRGPQ